LLYRLAARSAIWIVLYVLSTHYFGLNLSVSRRLANLPYVVWVVAFNNTQMLLFCAIETLCFPSARYRHATVDETSSRIMRAFNSNGLVVFLVANLLTGLANLSIDTLGMGDLGAMGLLGLYAALVATFALGLQRFDIRVRL
jgi:phosphatidylinositol glycan class W